MEQSFPIRFERLLAIEDSLWACSYFALTFLIVMVIFLAIWMVASGDNKQEVVRRRMEAVRKAERRGDVSLGLKLARDEMLSSVPAVHRLMLHWSWSVRLAGAHRAGRAQDESGQADLDERVPGSGNLRCRRHFHAASFRSGVLLGICDRLAFPTAS